MMRLGMLLAAAQVRATAGSDPDIRALAYDSRKVHPGTLFFALPGRLQHGGQFVDDALERGAAAVVSDAAPPPAARGRAAVHVRVEQPRRVMADMAAAFFQQPAARLQVAGITGTNGKTTVAFMLRDILAAAERQPGLLGTVAYEIGDRRLAASRTTPEAVDLQDMLAQMVQAGCRAAVMEVSSHALVQERVRGIAFDVAVFTNLTQDHLDYHETMERYFEAKTRLFRDLARGAKQPAAAINLDDPYGRRLAALGPFGAATLTFGMAADAADVRAERVQVSAAGSRFAVRSPWGDADIALRLPGRHNVSNALAALAAAGALGIPPARAAQALAAMVAVPGRLEAVPSPGGFQVFVDYAHTEDALRNVLTTLREITAGRLLVVFGCGGNRDRGKRPRMGAAAAALADHVVLTSDNPRKEDPGAIIAEIRAGCPEAAHVEVVEDRYEAIARAIALAEPGDAVLVAGKGHENSQEFAHTIIPFDDRQIVRDILGHRHDSP